MASSFKKRAASKPSYPRGTRPSFHNSSLLLSTGVPSLDAVLGGGVAVGTVLLIEEDTFGLYSRILLKYFLAEGVVCGHEVFVASAAEKPEHIVKDLPLPLDDGLHQATQPVRGEGRVREGGGEGQAKEEMEIAWRYQKMPQVESSFSNRFGHLYDISRTMDSDLLSRVATVHHFSPSPKEWDSELIQRIHETVEAQGFFVNQQCTGQRNLLRCAIHSLGTPLWGRGHSATPKFFHQLRALLRQSYAAALVTVPVHLFEDAALVQRMERLSDSVVRLESFAGSGMEGNPLYKDYHGLVHLVKLPTVNTLLAHQPLTFDLAFKLKRKKFLIETLHLPPDLSETVSRAPVSAHSKSSSAQAANDIQTQSSTRKNKIDF